MPRILLSFLLALLVTACSDGNPCDQAPRCDEGEALNCETACTVGPCSTGPVFQQCDRGATCTVVPGDRSDARFYRSRAVCALSLTQCDPATAPAPVCEDERFVTGCGAHRRDIRVFCSQSALYFDKVPTCCITGPGDGGTDAGTDAGTGDGGIPDAGPGGADAGR
ncbi:hypothetical protein ACN47A_30115 [Myxococcus fulvus]|uniref:hypothetical protein n=1 Tax=Myxococcus fulvus TaxID=33 RepID=UPI003B998A9C